MIGKTLGTYEVRGKLGSGGMGDVYHGYDTKLGRDVALKVLPTDWIADQARRRRFLAEARIAASLSHPYVAAVYDADECDSTLFLAMELVPGRTLRAIAHERRLDLSEVLRLGCEIAEGLAYAHERNVIHRDIKPENVMVRPDGHVKILDFGLAELTGLRKEASSIGPSQTITIGSSNDSGSKTSGTPAYMSPEQAGAEPTDGRSDIFSFGVMLYELITGTSPFLAPTTLLTLSAILHLQVPPASQRNPSVPPHLDRLLAKCLAKDPKERYQHADDLGVDLRRLRSELDPHSKAAAVEDSILSFHVEQIDFLPSVSTLLSPGMVAALTLSLVVGGVVGGALFGSAFRVGSAARRAGLGVGVAWMAVAVCVLLAVSVPILMRGMRHSTIRIRFTDDRDYEPLLTYLLTQMNYRTPTREGAALIYRGELLLRLLWDPTAKVRVHNQGRIVIVTGHNNVVRKIEKALWAMSSGSD